MSGNGGKTGQEHSRNWREVSDMLGSEPGWYCEEEQESALRIIEALSGVDAMLLERSDRAIRRKRFVWQYGKAWAAVVCVAVVGVLTWRGYQFMGGTDGAASGSNNAGGAMQMSSAAVSGEESNGNNGFGAEILTGEDSIMEGWETLPSDISGDAENQMGTSPSMALNGGGGQGGTSPSVAPSGGKNQGGTSPSISSNGGENQGGTSPSIASNGGESQGSTSPSIASNGGESQGGTSPSIASNGGENQGGTSPSVAPDNGGIHDDITGDEVVEGCGVPSNKTERLTEEEARNWETLGEYIPNKIPKGYAFESSYWNEDSQSLSILWCKGMDDIHLSIVQAGNCDTIDISKPELYDVRLYEIPYGESVPQEYRSFFDNPVFAWEDFSMEIVESRIRSYEDAGDTNTPRGRFNVLFPDGVLIKFSGDATVNQIWEMFQSLGL